MNQKVNSPAEVLEINIKAGIGKATAPLGKMILLGMMAGMFIALGGATSSTAVHSVSNVGLARTLAGCVFPVGLMMIIFVGGQLFTSNCMVVMAVFDKRLKFVQFVRNLCVVYFSNLIGAVLLTALIVASGMFDYSDGALGAYAIKVMLGKVAIEPVKAVASGILCNILVCVAVLMASVAQDATGKIWAIFFPIFAFVVGGFEHCVANMYYIPAGMMAAQNPVYLQKAVEKYGYSAEKIQSIDIVTTLQNFVPVTIGNIIGGAVCVSVLFYLINGRKGWKRIK